MIKKTLLISKILIGGGLLVLLFSLGCAGEDASNCVKPEVPEGIILECDWDVDYVMHGDFNNDESEDVGIYLWKIGDYGDSMPFWEEKNDDSYKQHLFLYEKDEDGAWKSLWHSSNLPYENVISELRDFDNDGENELVVLERPYSWERDGFSGETVAVWKWDEWGFKNIWRSEAGEYYNLNLDQF